ncbi:MAG TPA: hypothetical protein VFD92_06130 [Candidatus Binatia bacterium]|nr:hypothetical protein [Candidatus Binatia bacterium]
MKPAAAGCRRFFRERSVAVASAASSLVALVALVAVVPVEAAERVIVQVVTVFATNTGEHFDSQLAAMRRQLDKLPHYRSYQLMSRQSRDVSRGDPVDVEIPGGRILRIVPKSVGDDRVLLNVLLRQDSRAVVRTDVTLGPTGTVLVGGPRHGDGVLIIWIGAQPVSTAP